MSFLKNFFQQKKICVTHNGTFHSDDLFATATLSILNNGNIKIIRTRDKKKIEKGDYVYDVGGEYSPDKNIFDHHQKGGAGMRDNGAPYASFGLVWKKYGKDICKSKEVADIIEKKLVMPIDAVDNGVNIFDIKNDIAPYTIQDVIFSFRPSWKEREDYDRSFKKLIPIAENIITREIIRTRDMLEANSFVKKIYEESFDKRIVIIDGNYPWVDEIDTHKEPIYVVSNKHDLWRVEAVRKEKYSFESRKPFPESWAGKKDQELIDETGVSDAVFCHNARFLVVAKSKDGAITLAEKALLA